MLSYNGVSTAATMHGKRERERLGGKRSMGQPLTVEMKPEIESCYYIK
jgi:hypothetical protein